MWDDAAGPPRRCFFCAATSVAILKNELNNLFSIENNQDAAISHRRRPTPTSSAPPTGNQKEKTFIHHFLSNLFSTAVAK